MKIAFDESLDERILLACSSLKNEKNIDIVLVGNKTEILKKIGSLNLDLGNFEIFERENFEYLTEEFYELRKDKLNSFLEAKKLMESDIYFTTMLLKKGVIDGIISGATKETTDVLKPALQIIKAKDKIASSFFIMKKGEETLFFADCGFIVSPNAEELAEIAIQTNDSAKKYGLKPKVAMLSFSTLSNKIFPENEKIKNALEIVKSRRPDIIIDGELQFDAAYDVGVAKTKAQSSPVAGNANVFVFPDLNSGNIAYKIAQRLGGFTAIGPLIQGLNKPVNDLSRGCSAEDIVQMAKFMAN